MLIPTVFFAFLIEASLGDYNPSLGRDLYSQCVGVFTDNKENTQACLDSVYPDAEIVRKVIARCDNVPENLCAVMTVVSPKTKTILIVFRGSTTKLHVETQILEAYRSLVPWPSGGRISKYYDQAFSNLWNGGLEADFLAVSQEHPDFNLYVIGHSFGGSLAPLAGAHIAHNKLYPTQQIFVYTFGEPRIGDEEFSLAYEKLLPETYRVVHYKDHVPRVAGRYGDYLHHGVEIYYQSDMSQTANYTVRLSGETKSLSKGYIRPDQYDHLTYYNADFHKLLNSGCDYVASAVSPTDEPPIYIDDKTENSKWT